MPKPLPEIERCPFPPCKGDGLSQYAYIFPPPQGRMYMVECDKCMAQGPLRKTERGAIIAWNRAQRDE